MDELQKRQRIEMVQEMHRSRLETAVMSQEDEVFFVLFCYKNELKQVIKL